MSRQGKADGGYGLHFAEEDGVLRVQAYGDWSAGKASRQGEKLLARQQRSAMRLAGSAKTVVLECDAPATGSPLLSVFAAITRKAAEGGAKVDVSALAPETRRLLESAGSLKEPQQARRAGFLESVGGLCLRIPSVFTDVLAFIGEVTQSFGRFLMGRKSCSSADIWLEIRKCGSDALLIVSVISLLLGMIIAFVSGWQLSLLGAEMYMASLVTLSMVRVLGPVLTGIVMAGRTGASYAAILGSMQVNEEVDALIAFGISPADFLVFPRVLALALMMPFLTVYADCMGILGGVLVGMAGMGIAPATFLENVTQYVRIDSVLIGLLHAFVFGFVVSLCGCYQGIRCGRNAEAVGSATTSAVVYSIVGIIVSTSVLTIIFTVVSS